MGCGFWLLRIVTALQWTLPGLVYAIEQAGQVWGQRLWHCGDINDVSHCLSKVSHLKARRFVLLITIAFTGN